MNTIAQFPQPVLQHPVTDDHWYLQVSHAGALQVAGKTDAPLTNLQRVKFVDPTGRTAYRLGLSVDEPIPIVTLTPLAQASDAQYQDLSVWGINGREWNLSVTAAGAVTITSIGSQWPTATIGTLKDSIDRQWTLSVEDSGILTVTGPSGLAPVDSSQLLYLRTTDDTGVYQITVDTNGILFVTGPLDLSLSEVYEAKLTAPGGQHFLLSVDNAGTLFVESTSALDHVDEWPLVLQSRSNILYVVDSRFRAPVPGLRGRQYGRRRRG